MSAPSAIAHYRITSKLGEGGMGAVYRATDTKLGREVAVKLLPESFAADPDRLARFTREAQMLAALNHPNIAAIYGIESGAIVMELVEGQDLKGPVPVETAIPLARQIAVALEAAHDKGIIHRDLKPANIKVTADGTVKLLDFGLAKATDEAVSTSPATMSPTLSLSMTQSGMILGTAAYMSPEQARGKAVDKRADIWAFGVVLFELLTGTAIFGGGETVSDALAMVILKDPDWSALPAATPPRVRRLLERCLRKDPKQRLRDIGEARLILDEAEPEAPAPATAPLIAAPRRAWLPWTVAALAIVAAAFMALRPMPVDPALGPARFAIPMPPGNVGPGSTATAQAVPSPDGRTLAFIARDSKTQAHYLWIRPLSSTSAHRVDKTEGANYPFWSPDSQNIAFFAEDKLKRVSVSGGNVQTICDTPNDGSARISGDGGTWGPDGVVVFANYGIGALMKVPAVGGVPSPATALENDEQWHSWPQFLPDGRHLLYFAVNKNDTAKSAVYIQVLGSTNRILIMNHATRAAWAPPGYLLFVREGTLFAQRLDAGNSQLQGEPLSIAQDVSFNDSNGRSAFAVSRNGVLVYHSGNIVRMRQLSWRDRDGKELALVGKPAEYSSPVLSPDARSVAVETGQTSRVDTWILDPASGVLTRMTREGRDLISAPPVWSRDSQRLAITQTDNSIHEITVASGKAVRLAKEQLIAEDWFPDGRSLLCNDRTVSRLSVLSLADGGKLQTILETPYRKLQFRLSPDAKYVAYTSYETGAQEIHVASFPSFAVKRKVSTNGGTHPLWTKGGKEIVYRALDGTVMSAEIRTGAGIEAGIPKPLFKYNPGVVLTRFAVTADGQRFLINEDVQKEEGSPAEMNLVLNWAAEIHRP